MTAIPSNKKFIQIEEMEYRKSVSESTFQKLGGAVNYLNDNADKVNITHQLLTSGVFSWTCPSGVSFVDVTCVGGGGGGGDSVGATGGGAGGAGAVFSARLVTTPSVTYTITVGAGGAGGNKLDGSNGASSSFNGWITASGGAGGVAEAPATGGVGGNCVVNDSSKLIQLHSAFRGGNGGATGVNGDNGNIGSGGVAGGIENAGGGGGGFANGGSPNLNGAGGGAGYANGGASTGTGWGGAGGGGGVALSYALGSGVTDSVPS